MKYSTCSCTVINNPDVYGMGSNVASYSFYLGGKRTLVSLPNMVNYRLGADEGSPCDTLTSIDNLTEHDFKFKIFPNPVTKQQLQIFYSLPQNESGLFQIFDITGKVVFKYTLPPWSNEQSFKLPELSDGVYNCVIISGKERVSKKIAVINE